MLSAALVLVAGCVPDDDRLAESVPPRIHRSIEGDAIGITIPSGQGRLAKGNRFAAVRELLSDVGHNFGVKGSADLLEMRLVRELEVAAPTDLVGAERAMVRVAQAHSGVEVLDGELTLTFLDGRLHQVVGAPLSLERIGPAIDRLLAEPPGDVRAFEGALGAGCRATSERPAYDAERDRLVHVVDCAELTYIVDAHDGAVLSSASRTRQYAPHQNGVSVTTVADGTTNAVTPWFPVATASPGVVQHHGEVIDSEPRPGSATNCNYRMTYNGEPSTFPFANYHDSALGLLYLSGSCSAGGSTFTNTTDPNFEWQVAFDKIGGAARHAIWQPSLKLFAQYWPAETAPLNVVVSASDPSSCGGAWGKYTPSTRTICLAASLNGYNHWRTPLHEYAHYVQDMYNFDEYTTFEEKALAEGLADALALSFEHFRYNPLPSLDAAQTDQLFARGPGNGLKACIGMNCVTAAPTSSTSYVNKPPTGAPYHEGMALSQILWSLLNNRRCSGSGCSTPQRILTTSPDETMATIARDALIWTIVTSGSNPKRAEFVERWEDCILSIYPGYFDSAATGRLRAVFTRHFGPYCPDSDETCCEFMDRECGYCVEPQQSCF